MTATRWVTLMLRQCKYAFLAILVLISVGWLYLQTGRSRPNVLVILLDTLRADHLGMYGYERDTSPFLDSFAAQNVKFNFAVTAAPWTPPSVASIFTGKYPVSHGFFPPNSRETAKSDHSVLSTAHQTLAEIFQAHGYVTAAVSPNPWITKEFNFDQGFQDFVYLPRAPAQKINDAAQELLGKFRSQDKPFFLYLHYLDPHDPYSPPDPYRSLYSGKLSKGDYSEEMLQKIGLYDGEIRYLDDALKNLFADLQKDGLLEDLVVVIVGDHGEQFNEHGFLTHGNTVFNVETHVPLIVKFGRNSPQSIIDHPVSTIDIFPTLLKAADIDPPAEPTLALPLLDYVRHVERGGVMSRISRKLQQRAFVNFQGKKLIVGGTQMGEMLQDDDPYSNIVGVFDSRSDADEKTPLASYAKLSELQESMQQTLKVAEELSVRNSESERPLSEDSIEQLRSLGYLN
ncbi:MAG: sulfatase [Deltaproteobacteria bacterium]|nr:sulfatase [Deltaproteobacteria bacterium]